MSGRAFETRLAGIAAMSAVRAGAVLCAAAVATRQSLGIAVCASIAVLVVAAADAWRIGRQLQPLVRHVARHGDDSASTPPSAAAVRDALAAPGRLGVALFALGATAAVACLIADLVVGRPIAGGVVAALGIAATSLAASACAESTRSAVGSALLARVRAIDVAPPQTSSLPRAEALHGAALGASVVIAAAAMLALRGQPLVALVAGGPLAVAAAAGAAYLGRRRGSVEAAAIASLSTRARAVLAPGAPLAALDEDSPRALRAIGTSLDALSRRLAEDDAREAAAGSSQDAAQRMKTQFLAAMSHDLRSPLNSILGFSELLARGTDGPLSPAQHESVQAIRTSGAELLRLLTDIVDSARLEAGKLSLRRAWTPSVEILTEAVTQGRELVGDRPLRIEAELQPGLPPVYVDRQRVVQAVVGLFGHAASAMQTGVIRLSARVASGPPGPDRQVRVTVRDESRGVSEAQIARIFEAFRAISEPGGRRIGGLGLNLSLARALVRLHGGDIAVQSEAGVGTTFTIALPLDGPASASE